MRTFLVGLAALFLLDSPLPAGVIVGPGDVTVTNGDQAFDLIAVDLNAPVTLGPGTYTASLFNYQFTDFAGFNTTGTVKPLLLVAGAGFTPIAVGAPVTYSGATAFTSTSFGGTDTFTLASSTTVYAGLYWDATDPGGLEVRMPVGYLNNTGNSYVYFGGGTGAGASPPVVGTPVTATGEGLFNRVYDFSVTVNDAAIPEPSTSLLALSGGSLIAWACRRRTRPAP